MLGISDHLLIRWEQWARVLASVLPTACLIASTLPTRSRGRLADTMKKLSRVYGLGHCNHRDGCDEGQYASRLRVKRSRLFFSTRKYLRRIRWRHGSKNPEPLQHGGSRNRSRKDPCGSSPDSAVLIRKIIADGALWLAAKHRRIV